MIWGALGLAACGGLAADGDELEEAERCTAVGPCAPATGYGDAASRVLTRGITPDGQGPGLAPPGAGNGPAAAPEAGVGSVCGAPSAAADGAATESVAVGEVSLTENPGCGAGNLCLTRARSPGIECSTAAPGPDGACPDERVVPIPPSLAPALPELDRVCTCRCGGYDEGAEYCACPVGMTCRELIRSLGTNGAALAYAGSYCLY